MSDEISMPVAAMRATGQQMLTETETLDQATMNGWRTLEESQQRLPTRLQADLSPFLASWRTQTTQLIQARRALAAALTQGAEVAGNTEHTVGAGFQTP